MFKINSVPQNRTGDWELMHKFLFRNRSLKYIRCQKHHSDQDRCKLPQHIYLCTKIVVLETHVINVLHESWYLYWGLKITSTITLYWSQNYSVLYEIKHIYYGVGLTKKLHEKLQPITNRPVSQWNKIICW